MQYFFADIHNISIAKLCIFLCICTYICNFLGWLGEGLMVLNFFNDGIQLSLFEMMVSNCPLCYNGVKLSAESNCPLLNWWCQIVLFSMMVSKCLQCQIVCGVKLSYSRSRCQIVLGVKSYHHSINAHVCLLDIISTDLCPMLLQQMYTRCLKSRPKNCFQIFES